MADREKAIKGLEGCVAPARKGWPYKPNIMEAGCEWYDCPYSSNCEDILFDALELLKAQEPHVMTEADFDNNPMVDQNGKLPAWCEHKELNGIGHGVNGWVTINRGWVCGYTLKRYWTSRPTEEQRKAVKWK